MKILVNNEVLDCTPDEESKILQERANATEEQASDSEAYARKRKAEYPSIEECVHAILDDDLVALQEKRAAVKARYPK